MCRAGYHVWQWGSSSTDDVGANPPLHLRCQCGRMSWQKAQTLEDAARRHGERIAELYQGACQRADALAAENAELRSAIVSNAWTGGDWQCALCLGFAATAAEIVHDDACMMRASPTA